MEPKSGVRTDCFAYRRDKYRRGKYGQERCNVLDELVCIKRRCSFFETTEQYLANREKYRKAGAYAPRDAASGKADAGGADEAGRGGSGVGMKVRLRRVALGLSQKELAERAGISQSGLSKYERGGREPDGEALMSLCRALGCTEAELLG